MFSGSQFQEVVHTAKLASLQRDDLYICAQAECWGAQVLKVHFKPQRLQPNRPQSPSKYGHPIYRMLGSLIVARARAAPTTGAGMTLASCSGCRPRPWSPRHSAQTGRCACTGGGGGGGGEVRGKGSASFKHTGCPPPLPPSPFPHTLPPLSPALTSRPPSPPSTGLARSCHSPPHTHTPSHSLPVLRHRRPLVWPGLVTPPPTHTLPHTHFPSSVTAVHWSGQVLSRQLPTLIIGSTVNT